MGGRQWSGQSRLWKHGRATTLRPEPAGLSRHFDSPKRLPQIAPSSPMRRDKSRYTATVVVLGAIWRESIGKLISRTKVQEPVGLEVDLLRRWASGPVFPTRLATIVQARQAPRRS